MRQHSIARIVALVSALPILACNEPTVSGPSSTDSRSAAASSSSPVFAKLPPGCRRERGRLVLTKIDAPNDPFGRSVGPSEGGLKGIATEVFTTFTPGPGTSGVIDVTSLAFWVMGPTDTFTANGVTRYFRNSAGDYEVLSMTQTIVGGTGRYEGATGTLHFTGMAYDLTGFGGGPGKTLFDLAYDGSVCT